PVFRDIPKDRHTSLMASPSSSRATNRTRSSIAEHSFQGIDTPRQRERCYLCVRYDSSPMSRVAHFVRPGDMGDTTHLRHRSRRVPNGLSIGFLLLVDVSEVVGHECDDPDSVVDLLQAQPLAGNDGGDSDLLLVRADAAAAAGGDEAAAPARPPALPRAEWRMGPTWAKPASQNIRGETPCCP